MDKKEREELLGQTRSSGYQQTNIPMDYYLDEQTRLRSFHSHVDDLLDQGSTALKSLKDQRTVLSGARSRLADIANTLGMSQTVMRLIEKRASGDKIILFGGMILFCLVMFLIWKYLT